MAVARLGYEIDSSGAVVAEQNLDDMAAAAKRAEVGSKRLTGGAGAAGKAISGVTFNARMLVPQLSQIGQQFTATGQLGQAVAVQAADIGLAFGVVGTVIGTVAGVALPSLIDAFSDGVSEAERFEDRLDSLGGLMEGLNNSSDMLEYSMDELTEKFGHQAEVVRGLIVNLAQYRVSIAQNELREFGDMARIATDQFSGLSRSAALVAQEIEYLNQQDTAFSRSRIADLTKQIANEAAEMGEQFGITADEAILLSDAFAQLGAAGTTEQVNQELVDLNELMKELGISTEMIPDELEQAIAKMSELGILSAELAETMRHVAVNSSFAPGLNPNMPVSSLLPPRQRDRGGRGGGGSRVDEFARDLERLRESLRTEREVVDEWYAQQQEILANRRAMEILGIEGHNQAKLRLEEEYLDRLRGINQGYQGSALDQAQTFFGDMASALQGGNDKMIAAAQTFASIEALINAYRAYNQVIADPTLPWFAKIPAAAGVLAAGLRTVSSIKSLGGGSSGTSATAGVTASTPTSAPQQTRAIISLQGGRSRFTVEEINDITRQLQEQSDDGVIIEGFTRA